MGVWKLAGRNKKNHVSIADFCKNEFHKGILLFFPFPCPFPFRCCPQNMTNLMKAVLLCVAIQAAFATMPARFGSHLLCSLHAFTHAYSCAPHADEMTSCHANEIYAYLCLTLSTLKAGAFWRLCGGIRHRLLQAGERLGFRWVQLRAMQSQQWDRTRGFLSPLRPNTHLKGFLRPTGCFLVFSSA